MRLTDPVTEIKGVGQKTAALLEKAGIGTVEELLKYYPRDYKVYGSPLSVDDSSFDDKGSAAYRVHVTAQAKLAGRGRLKMVILSLPSISGNVQAIWYNMPYVRNQLVPGTTIILYGRLCRKRGRRVLEHPEILSEEKYAERLGGLWPIYSLTAGLSQNMLSKLLDQVFAENVLMQDLLPSALRRQYDLAEYNYAVRQIHFPDSHEDYLMARKRLVFDEFFEFILSMRMMKTRSGLSPNYFPVEDFSGGRALISALPYQLTEAQAKVVEEIRQDLSGPTMMNRLIQGDVGSGKTVIAAIAMAAVVRAGWQACMMAPTEVLAEQHFDKLSALFEPLGIHVILLTGSSTAAQKRKIYEKISSHAADIIIGTQALFQEKVVYDKLGLIVTDEQHRFGVHQRELLMKKGVSEKAHVLVMSATPIPRTLAMIVYGDMDISVVDQKPAGRQPIKNSVVGIEYRPAAYRFIEKQVRMGHQAYVICPMVEANEEIDAENVIDYSEKLKRALPQDIVVTYLHGKMKPAEKNDIMNRFAKGEIQVLVSTTVVEVGVDVANATVMMIENAERFGLSQLHQLRGRVGRSDSQSYCIFIYGMAGAKIKERLEIMRTSNDGFKIASEDMRLRGPGDMFGLRQSGDLNFSLGDIIADSETLMLASDAADKVMASGDYPDPDANQTLRAMAERFIYKESHVMTL